MDLRQIYHGDHFAKYTYICNHYVVHPDDVLCPLYLNKTGTTRENEHIIVSGQKDHVSTMLEQERERGRAQAG